MKPNKGKNPAEVALGRIGGLKGGKARGKELLAARKWEIAPKTAAARMTAISPQRRSEIARNAVLTRWKRRG
jgi:hypothetical protein